MNNTYRHYNQNQEEAVTLVRELISPAPEEFIAEQVAVIFGDKNGTFAEKYGDAADEAVDGKQLQIALTSDLSDWQRAADAN